MNSHEDPFFVGHYAYRAPRTLTNAVIMTGLGLAALSAGVWLALSFRSKEIEGSLLIVFGVVVFSVGVASLWAWISNRVDQLVISRSGIKFGGRSWTWDRVKALTVAYVPPLRSYCIRLWVDRTRGQGHGFVFDEDMTPQEVDRLLSEVSRAAQERGLTIRCGRQGI